MIMMTQDYYGSSRSGYFHLCSDGSLTHDFLICEEDFRAAFNLVGVCASNCDAHILAFSLEDTHLHILMYGQMVSCVDFKTMFEDSWAHHIARTRGNRQDACVEMDIIPVDNAEYLMCVGTYTVVQPTKDGKQIMPYDYRWGTGSMYFRSKEHHSLWMYGSNGDKLPIMRADNYSKKELQSILCSRRNIPAGWLLCNRLLLPDNYVDVAHFESIYRTANCFRVFLASNSNRDQIINERIAAFRGVSMEDDEARRYCHEISKELFGIADVRRLDARSRVQLGQQLRRRHHLSRRQIAALARLPYSEVCKYI